MLNRYPSPPALLSEISQGFVQIVQSHLGLYRDVLDDIERRDKCTTTPRHAIGYPECLDTLDKSSRTAILRVLHPANQLSEFQRVSCLLMPRHRLHFQNSNGIKTLGFLTLEGY